MCFCVTFTMLYAYCTVNALYYNIYIMQSLALFFVGTIGSSMLCYATPYTPETMPVKLGTFALFTSVMGITLAPLLTIAGWRFVQ